MKLFHRIQKVIHDPYSIVIHMNYLNLLGWMPPVLYEKLRYRAITGRKLNLRNPVSFGDKMIWMKLYWRDERAKRLADKYLVRDFIREKGLSEILNEVYGVYNDVSEVDLSKLPDSFVLKVTNGSGWNVLCRDKSKMDWDKEFQKISEWMKQDYYTQNREWVYKGSKNLLICEQFLQDDQGKLPKDYKFMCINGDPKLIQVDSDRYGTDQRRSYMDENWNFQDATFLYPNEKDNPPPKPKNFERMLEIARTLSEGFPFTRVDLYNLDGVIYFGEITFFHQAGYGVFQPQEYDLYVGSLITLPSH